MINQFWNIALRNLVRGNLLWLSSMIFISYSPLKIEWFGENDVLIENKTELVDSLIIGNNKTLRTSLLPLTKIEISIPKAMFTPTSGGDLAVIEDKILIIDYLGKLSVFDGKSLRSIPTNLPTNYDKYRIENGRNPASRKFRIHNLAYDKIQSRIIVSYANYDKHRSLYVAAINIDKEELTLKGDWTIIFKSNQESNSLAGGMMFIQDDYLYMSSRSSSTLGEDLNSFPHLDAKTEVGKIFRINLKTNKAKMFSMGHRNIAGISALNNNDIIATEHGPQGGDEINLINKGNNYGWPLHTYGTRYRKYDYSFDLSPEGLLKNYTEPLFAFVPSIAISKLIQLKNFHSKWDGDLLVGSLKAQTLYRLKLADKRILFSEPIWIGHRIRDIVQLGEKIILLTDDAKLITLTVDSVKLSQNSKGDNGQISRRPELSVCITCHQFTESTPVSLSPTLANIFNKKIGSDTYNYYSVALKEKEGIWDEGNLKKYIKNPASFIEGTTMPSLNLTDKEVDKIVHLLKTVQ